MMRSGILVALLVATGMVSLAYAAKGDVAAKYPDPEDAIVKNGVFQDDYFGLRYPLPPGWVEDLKGPEPSASGYYSLAALKPEGELVATMQISAQDNFFAPETIKRCDGFSEGDEERPGCQSFGSACSDVGEIGRPGFCAPRL